MCVEEDRFNARRAPSGASRRPRPRAPRAISRAWTRRPPGAMPYLRANHPSSRLCRGRVGPGLRSPNLPNIADISWGNETSQAALRSIAPSQVKQALRFVWRARSRWTVCERHHCAWYSSCDMSVASRERRRAAAAAGRAPARGSRTPRISRRSPSLSTRCTHCGGCSTPESPSAPRAWSGGGTARRAGAARGAAARRARCRGRRAGARRAPAHQLRPRRDPGWLTRPLCQALGGELPEPRFKASLVADRDSHGLSIVASALNRKSSSRRPSVALIINIISTCVEGERKPQAEQTHEVRPTRGAAREPSCGHKWARNGNPPRLGHHTPGAPESARESGGPAP